MTSTTEINKNLRYENAYEMTQQESLVKKFCKLELYLINLDIISFINHTEYDELYFIQNSLEKFKSEYPFFTKTFYDINYVLLKNKLQVISTEFLSIEKLEDLELPYKTVFTEIELLIFKDLFNKLVSHELNLATLIKYLSYKYNVNDYLFYEEVLNEVTKTFSIENYDSEGNYLLKEETNKEEN